MKTKHRRILQAIFASPTRGGIVFSDIEALVIAIGGDVREGEGSRVVFEIKREPENTFIVHTLVKRQRNIRLKNCANGSKSWGFYNEERNDV